MKSGFAIVHRITQTEFDIDLGASLSAGFIEIVSASGQPTGAIYMTGIVGAPAIQINESTALVRTALGAVPQFFVVYDVDGAQCAVADPTDVVKCNRVLGLAHKAATTGNEVQIISFGELNYTTGFSNGPIYLSTGGNITYAVPTSGVSLRVGYVSSPTKIMVKIERPIVFA
jgi:hypothetical protein